MSMITAAYSSYTSLSISQVSTAEADADTKGSTATASVYSRGSSSAPDAPVTISYHAKMLLARASAEQSVVDQLQAQLDAFRTGGSAAALRGSDASGGLSGGTDLFEIISGASDDSIRVQASNATIDSGAGNDVIDVDG